MKQPNFTPIIAVPLPAWGGPERVNAPLSPALSKERVFGSVGRGVLSCVPDHLCLHAVPTWGHMHTDPPACVTLAHRRFSHLPLCWSTCLLICGAAAPREWGKGRGGVRLLAVVVFQDES